MEGLHRVGNSLPNNVFPSRYREVRYIGKHSGFQQGKTNGSRSILCHLKTGTLSDFFAFVLDRNFSRQSRDGKV